VHYHFLTPEDFDAKIAENAFLEWAWVHGARRYGTLASSILDLLAQGRSLVISVDVQGVESFRRAAATNPLLARHMTTVFIVVDRERLVARMRLRAQDDENEIAGRMKTAERELREAAKFDFTIESRTRDEDFAALLAIVEQARARATRD
jgi:guanylate kinase